MTEYLNSENVDQESACGVEEIPLRHKPEMLVNVKQLPVGELRRLSKAIKRGGFDGEKAEAELIQKSIVNADESPVFTLEKAKAIRESNAPLYASLMHAIGKANNKTDDEISREADALEKN